MSSNMRLTRRKAKPRTPAPYVAERADGRADSGCRSCAVRVAGHPGIAAAQSWCEHHRCDGGGYVLGRWAGRRQTTADHLRQVGRSMGDDKNAAEIRQLQRIEDLLNDQKIDTEVKYEVVATIARAYPDSKDR